LETPLTQPVLANGCDDRVQQRPEGHLERDLGYNHFTKNLFALALYGVAVEGKVAASLGNQLAQSIRSQVLADGGHAELCPMYHAAYLGDLMILAELGSAALGEPLGDLLEDVIPKMQQAACGMSFSSGEMALFGDSWQGEAPTAADLGLRPQVESETVHALPATGYVKISQSRLEVIVDVGAAGPDDNPGHAHDDFLSLEAAIDGTRVIVDYGVETYAPGEGRSRTRQNASHNGPPRRRAARLGMLGQLPRRAPRDSAGVGDRGGRAGQRCERHIQAPG
jgi:uncharacterized heparinase superfamily protein